MAYFFLNQVSQVTLDLAFGGMWYAIVAAEQVTEKSGKSSVKGRAETGAGTWKENCQAGGDDQGGFSVFY